MLLLCQKVSNFGIYRPFPKLRHLSVYVAIVTVNVSKQMFSCIGFRLSNERSVSEMQAGLLASHKRYAHLQACLHLINATLICRPACISSTLHSFAGLLASHKRYVHLQTCLHLRNATFICRPACISDTLRSF